MSIKFLPKISSLEQKYSLDFSEAIGFLAFNPDLIDQGKLNLCASAAILRAFAKQYPWRFQNFCGSLMTFGLGKFGDVTITLDQASLDVEVWSLKFGSKHTLPNSCVIVSRILMIALNDYAIRKYSVPQKIVAAIAQSSTRIGKWIDGEELKGITTPTTVRKLVESTGLFEVVGDINLCSVNWIKNYIGASEKTRRRTQRRMRQIEKRASHQNLTTILLISLLRFDDAAELSWNGNSNARPFGTDPKEDSWLTSMHYIVLLNAIDASTDKLLHFWTWGRWEWGVSQSLQSIEEDKFEKSRTSLNLLNSKAYVDRAAFEKAYFGYLQFAPLAEELDSEVNKSIASDHLLIWVQAFIPKDIASVTVSVPDGSGRTMLPNHPIIDTYTGVKMGFLTDQRGFSSDWFAKYRFRLMCAIDPHKLQLVGYSKSTGQTVGVSPEDGKVERTGFSDAGKLHCDSYKQSGRLKLQIRCAARNPLVKFSPDIDLDVELTIQKNEQGFDVTFSGWVNSFPAFEICYSYMGKSGIGFSKSPDLGSTPFSLIDVAELNHVPIASSFIVG